MQPTPPCTEAQMLIRKPAASIFNAFIDPAITTQFWFTKSSGPLTTGIEVSWEWEMYNAKASAKAITLETDKRIVFEWGGNDAKRLVEIKLEALDDNHTYVTATEWGYTETGDALLAAIKDSTGGFTTVLDNLKALLEHGLRLNLIGDKFNRKPL